MAYGGCAKGNGGGPSGLFAFGNVYVPSSLGPGIRLYFEINSTAISFQRTMGLLVQYSIAFFCSPVTCCMAAFISASSAKYSTELGALGASMVISLDVGNICVQLPPFSSVDV